ncbi:uncharacterized protein LOC144701842 isoform X2 [Wolffia australiana]
MMRGGGPGRKKWCDRRRLMIGVCCVNFLALLFVILSLHTSIYFSPSSPSIAGASSSFISIPETNFSREQIEKMKEFIELRRAAEPTELAKLANSLWKKLSGKRKEAGLSPRMKQKVADEILQMLKALEPRAYMTEQQGGSTGKMADGKAGDIDEGDSWFLYQCA